MPRRLLVDLNFLTIQASKASQTMSCAFSMREKRSTLKTTALVTGLKILLATMHDKSIKFSSVVLCDDLGPYFREVLYPGYKKKRKNKERTPEEHEDNIDRLHCKLILKAVAQALGATVAVSDPLRIKGMACYGEADDVITTMAHRFSEAGDRVYIYGNDLDLTQCTRPEVTIIRPIGGTTSEVDDRNLPLISPSGFDGPWDCKSQDEIILFKAILGDSSDEYSGVKGIGKKKWYEILTLFREYGLTLRDCLEKEEHFQSIFPEKYRNKIEGQHKTFRQCAILAATIRDIKIRRAPTMVVPCADGELVDTVGGWEAAKKLLRSYACFNLIDAIEVHRMREQL